MNTSERPHEGVLSDVLSVGPIPRHTSYDGEHRIDVLVEEKLESDMRGVMQSRRRHNHYCDLILSPVIFRDGADGH